ncbi:MAG: N-acetyltransferase [Planctomycetaceae bacterium]|nr:N-acetyltransferase [Planctomycetaceae bacterium]HCK40807.1 N-acetyltransferase [Planctomycetaceae bacterium]
MSLSFSIRSAGAMDAASLLEIYRPYIDSSTTSFELRIPAVGEFADRIQNAVEKWSWLLAEVEGQPVGYAYGSTHRVREAYAYSVETSVYVLESYHRRGIANALYENLFAQLQERGYVSAFAGITLPNDPSVKFHKQFGFKPIGIFPRVGFKFDTWLDVEWLYCPIQ